MMYLVGFCESEQNTSCILLDLLKAGRYTMYFAENGESQRITLCILLDSSFALSSAVLSANSSDFWPFLKLVRINKCNRERDAAQETFKIMDPLVKVWRKFK